MKIKKIDGFHTARCFINDDVFRFQLLEIHKTADYHTVCLAKCLDNNKYAWLDDENGMAFEGEDRVIVEFERRSCMNFFTLWGGVLRPKYK